MGMVEVIETTQVAKVTGPDSINRTDERFGIHATDLGILWDGGDGRVRVLFGDTYGAGWGGDGPGPQHADWRYNVLAYSSAAALGGGLRIDEVVPRSDGLATQILPGDRPDEATVIPNAGITVDGNDYVHYMSVREWGKPGNWITNYAGIAVSKDGGRSWEQPRSATWRNRAGKADHRFQIGAFAAAGEHVYLLGTTNGRFGDAYLARARPENLLDTDRYEYLTASGWGPDEQAAAPVLSGPVGELSVAYNSYFGHWLAVHLDEDRAAIVLRSADRLEGPWSAGKVLVSGKDYPALYGGYLHPWAMEGPDIHYLISQWRPYNVFHLRSRLTEG
jgi:hypothetical protein